MPRIAYVNGRYEPFAAACIHIEDRGYQFADGVYEVVPVVAGALVNTDRHLARLARSLAALEIRPPLGDRALLVVIREVVARNRVRDGIVYLQVTRGVARRDHAFPAVATPAALVVTARSLDPARFAHLRREGVRVVTMPDERWARCDIKSVALLANVLAKQRARGQGAYEAWLLGPGGEVREGASTSAWIVTRAGEIVTRPLDAHILPGVTRAALLAAAGARGHRLVERAFSLDEARSAAEAFLTAASAGVLPVVAIDGAPVGDGRPGPVTASLAALTPQAARNPAGE